jgi:Kef-type K+ transport system membrane component KefB
MAVGIFDIGLVILIAAALGVVAKLLRQPIILAYLATGAIIGYYRLLNIDSQSTFQVFSNLGIMFLLFLVGMEINYSALRHVGKTSLIVGILQVVVTSCLGFFLAQFLGFALLPSAYIAAALTFSSTVIVVKLLSEKKDLSSLYGKITVGVLLVQDFVVILLLIVLGGLQSGGGVSMWQVAVAIVKGIALFALMLWLGRRIVPLLFDKVARSTELLFLISLAWVFLLAAIVQRVGFSIEIAGFLAGVALANSSEHYQIASRIRPLRDFFILIFFAILGSSLVLSNLHGLAVPLTVLSAFVLIINPLVVLTIMGIMGYRRRTSFLTGLTMGQVSEFSLVLAALGLRLGHLTESVVSLITVVAVISITISCYFITHADVIFRKLSPALRLFERKTAKEGNWREKEFHKPIILIGAHRIGQSIVHALRPEDVLVIDFDPDVIERMKQHGFEYIFGDVADPEILEKANIANARLVICTSPDYDDNRMIIHKIKSFPNGPKVVVRAESEKELHLFYAAGADYVLMPHFTSGQYLGKTIALDPEVRILEHLKKRDIEVMQRHAA